MSNFLLIILIIGLSIKANAALSQMITITQFHRKVISITQKRTTKESFHVPRKFFQKKNVDRVQIAETLNSIDLYRQFNFKRSKIVSLPLNGIILITSRFGERIHPVLKNKMLHTGIDLRADYDMVNTIAIGIIAEEGYDARAGNYLIIQHRNGIESIYCHLSKFLSRPGDLVFAGDTIAISGATGAVTATHLHFAIKENGKFIDPFPLLKAISRYNKNY